MPAVQPTDLTLDVLPGAYEVAKFPPGSAPPPDLFAAASAHALVSLTRTADEISVVRPATGSAPGGVVEGGWRALKVRGPLPFEMVGVLARLSAALAAASVSIFAVSTYDTDYLLVKGSIALSVAALQAAGCRVFDDAFPEAPLAAPATTYGEAVSEPVVIKKEKKSKHPKKTRPVVAPPPAAPVLTGEAAALHDCFEAYDPDAPAPASSSSSDDGLGAAFRAAPTADAGLKGLTTEFAGLISEDIVTAAAPAPLKLRPAPARYPAAAVANRPVQARPPPAQPIVVDNRYAPKTQRLAEAFGSCADAPLQGTAAPQQLQLQLGPHRTPVSVSDAFGGTVDGRGPANGWAV